MGTSHYPYLKLWIILFLSLILFIALSITDSEIRIGSYTVKKAPFRESLIHPNYTSNVEGVHHAVAKNILHECAMPDSVVVDQSPQVFLIIGDSMTPNLARRLAAYAGKNGHRAVHSVNWDSSTTVAWAESDRIEQYIAEYKPSFIFVCLGSNECYMRNPEQRIPIINKLIEKFGNVPFVWIGPPRLLKQQNKYNDMLDRVLGSDRFFRSDSLMLQRGEDNIHPVQSASNIWMDSIMQWITHSAHPILAEVPTIDTKPAKITFVSFGPNRHKNIEKINETHERNDTITPTTQEVLEYDETSSPSEPSILVH